MRKAKEIYNDVHEECHKNNCQGLKTIAILSIEKAQKEMFYFIYDKIEETKNEEFIDFIDKLSGKLLFNCDD